MTRHAPTNIAASIRQRLYNLAKERQEDFNFVLGRFVAERLLFRLSISDHANNFVLKGALLFLLWSDHLNRPTRDVDLLGFGESSIEKLETIFRDICRIEAVEDGMVFDPDSVHGESIREDQDYEGVRRLIFRVQGRTSGLLHPGTTRHNEKERFPAFRV